MAKTQIIASAVASNMGDAYTTQITIGEHQFIADEPFDVGGDNKGPAPGDYLCMALASCTAITLRMYAQRKNWEVGEIQVNVKLVKGDQVASGVNTFYCSIHFTGSLSEEQLKRLLEISKACPIDRLLKKPSDIVVVVE